MSGRTATSPLFQTPQAAGVRRLLLVSCLFPPSTLVGALRWEKILQFAFARGWSADVISLGYSDASPADLDRLTRIGPGLRLFGVGEHPSPLERAQRWRAMGPELAARRLAAAAADIGSGEHADPRANARRLAAVKGTLFAHDYFRKWRRWAERVGRLGAGLARETTYALVASSGPPHMAHEAARLVAHGRGLPLLIDFRDPWSSEDAVLPAFRMASWLSLSGRYEGRAVAAAARIVMNTESAADFMRAKYPLAADRVVTVMNGADGPARTRSAASATFTISYTGSLYGGRRVQTLFRAVGLAIQRCGACADDFRLHIMGVDEVQKAALDRLAETEGISASFRCDTRRPRPESLDLVSRSAVLVVLPQVHTMSVPAKVFEYVQQPAWLLVLTESGTATFRALEGTTADLIEPHDLDGIAARLAAHYRSWRNGAVPLPLNHDGRFSRERQSERLLVEMEAIRRRAPLAAPPPDAGG